MQFSFLYHEAQGELTARSREGPLEEMSAIELQRSGSEMQFSFLYHEARGELTARSREGPLEETSATELKLIRANVIEIKYNSISNNRNLKETSKFEVKMLCCTR